MRPVQALTTLAWVLVAAALSTSRGHFEWRALALVSLAAAAAAAAAVLGRGRPPVADRAREASIARRFLAGVLVAFCTWHVVVPPGIYVDPPRPWPFRVLATTALVVAGSYFLRLPGGVARWRFPALAACFLAMAATVVIASPLPAIDVWWFQQYAASVVVRGRNPYDLAYPNIYGSAAVYGPGMLVNGRVEVFPYPPLTFLLEAPVVAALGDCRLLLLALAAAAVAALRRLHRGEALELAGLAFLFQPRSFFVVEQAWTEPLVAAAFAAAALALVRWRETARGWVAAGLAGGLLLATKQYAPLLALPLALAAPSAGRWRAAGLALAALGLTLLPFAIWNPGELWRDLAMAQVLQPFRWDALSWLVPAARALGRPTSALWGFAAAGLVLAATLRARPSPGQAARVAAAAFVALVLFNKQAFCNYYWLGAFLLLAAFALAEREGDAAPGSGRPPAG